MTPRFFLLFSRLRYRPLVDFFCPAVMCGNELNSFAIVLNGRAENSYGDFSVIQGHFLFKNVYNLGLLFVSQ